ncbi:PAN/Apple domain [Sesbania bispinosa]|nr:PAN/Apple domain [Sesbania bispinosa]
MKEKQFQKTTYGKALTIQLIQFCQCVEGFSPKSLQAWNSLDWSGGCLRIKPLTCNDENMDGFIKYSKLKVPDTTHTSLDEKIHLPECRTMCLSNCSCMAYANSDIISGAGSGCVMWFGDLIDIRQFEDGGKDLYIRMSISELVNHEEPRHGHTAKV